MNPTIASAWSLGSLLILSPLAGQIGGSGKDGVFNPKSDVTLDTTGRPAGFEYKSIHIPAGVTVTLIGTNPAILGSQGPVTIAGRLSADSRLGAQTSSGGIGGPGGYDGGDGSVGTGRPGKGPGGGLGGIAPFGSPGSGEPAAHATPAIRGSQKTYGSAMPFDLRGGSGSGGGANPVSWQIPAAGGSGGGGTIVVFADGAVRVEPGGVVSAASIGMGSGGSIWLRSMTGVRIDGQVDAAGKGTIFNLYKAGDGFIRFDSYGSDPMLGAGAKVTPAPTPLTMPNLRAETALQIAFPYRMSVDVGPNDLVAFYVAANGASIPLPPLGTLGLDPATLLLLGAARSGSGMEPVATLTVFVPNDPNLRGRRIHVQAITPTTTAAPGPKLSNVLSDVVR